MTFAYCASPDAVKGLQTFHDKGEKVSKNALNLAEVLQESGSRDAGQRNNPQVVAEIVQHHHP